MTSRFKRYGTGAILSAAAFLLGLQSFLFDEYPFDEGGVKFAHVAHLASGFYAWELAFLLSLAYCLAMMVGARKTA